MALRRSHRGKRRVLFAAISQLAANPKLLILGEPTEGIQPGFIKDIG